MQTCTYQSLTISFDIQRKRKDNFEEGLRGTASVTYTLGPGTSSHPLVLYSPCSWPEKAWCCLDHESHWPFKGETVVGLAVEIARGLPPVADWVRAANPLPPSLGGPTRACSLATDLLPPVRGCWVAPV